MISEAAGQVSLFAADDDDVDQSDGERPGEEGSGEAEEEGEAEIKEGQGGVEGIPGKAVRAFDEEDVCRAIGAQGGLVVAEESQGREKKCSGGNSEDCSDKMGGACRWTPPVEVAVEGKADEEGHEEEDGGREADAGGVSRGFGKGRH